MESPTSSSPAAVEERSALVKFPAVLRSHSPRVGQGAAGLAPTRSWMNSKSWRPRNCHLLRNHFLLDHHKQLFYIFVRDLSRLQHKGV